MKKILFTILVITLISVIAFSAGTNLIKNGNFEGKDQASEEAWKFDSWQANGQTEYTAGKLTIQAQVATHSMASQEVTVEKDKVYKITGDVVLEKIGAENVDGKAGTGAYVSIVNTFIRSNIAMTASPTVQKLVLYVKPQVEKVSVMACLGGYGELNTGKAVFDNIEMVEVTAAEIPADAVVADITPPNAPSDNQAPDAAKKSSKTWIIIGVVALLVVGGVAYYIFGMKKGEETEIDEDEDEEDEDDE